MRLVIVLLLCGAAARADVSVRNALLTEGGFADGRGDIVPVAVSPSRGWLAVIDEHDSCCIAATLVLHVLTWRNETIAEIPFGCADEGCEEKTDRPRANRFLQRYGFVVPADAISIPRDHDSDEPRSVRAGELTFTRSYDELIVEARPNPTRHTTRRTGASSWSRYTSPSRSPGRG